MKTIDWTKLTFSYLETDYIVRCHYRNGQWGKVYRTEDKNITIPAAAAGLQYAQQCFEGLKAYRQVDGSVAVFRPILNAERMQASARGVYMPPVPTDIFLQAIEMAIIANKDYIPPYGTGATLYIRPMLYGISPRIEVCSAEEFEFCIVVSPIGPYYPCGFGTTPYVIVRDVDRAAPYGTGQWKVGGNYASSFRATEKAHAENTGVLFLDSKEHRFLDECGAANIFMIKEHTYVTPQSDSILPSIINRSLMELCPEIGLNVEQRRIAVEELVSFSEAAACGTGAAISPISRIYDPLTHITYYFGEEAGPICQKLYQRLRDIQFGRAEDVQNWGWKIKI